MSKYKNRDLFVLYKKIQRSLIGFLIVIDLLWVASASFAFRYDVQAVHADVVLLSLLSLAVLILKKLCDGLPIVGFVEAILFLFVAVSFLLLLSYLGATLQFPFIDPALAGTDGMLGIHTPTVVFWFRDHPEWDRVFRDIYNTYPVQFFAIIFYFSAQNKTIAVQRFLTRFMIACFLTLFLSALLPASGPYTWYHYTPSKTLADVLAHLYELRNNILDIRLANGIVTFPSFHSVMALIFMYTFRHEAKYIFISVCLLNILMIFSCIPIGEHYFADLLGAIPVFLLAVWLEGRVFGYAQRKDLHQPDGICLRGRT